MASTIWSGDKIKALLPALGLGNFATIRSGTVNPQVTPTAGIRGDVYIRTGTTPTIFQKVTTDGTDTSWTLIPAALTALAGSSVIVTDTLGNLKTDPGILYDSATDILTVPNINTTNIQRATPGTLAIGDDGNSTTINIGTTGSTINLQGTTVYQNVTNADVANKQITLNVGGGAGTATLSGVEIEEDGLITAYVHTSADRNSWQMLAPNTAGIITLTPGALGFTIDQGSHDPVTLTAVGATPNANGASLTLQALTLQPADGTNPGLITAIDQTIGGNKTFTGTITASNFTGSVSGTNTGDVTLATFGTAPNASGASLNGQILTLQPADATNPGGVSTTTQSFGGFKTFTDHVSIIGSTDNVQLIVKQFAGQTTSGLLEVQSNTGSNYFQVNRLGKTTVTGNLEVDGTDGSIMTVLIKGAPSANVASFAVVDDSLAQLFEVGSSGTIGSTYVAQVHGDFNVTGNITGINLSGTNTGNVSLSAVGAVPNANGATLTGQVLNLQPADASFPGVVTTGTQTFAGIKTFTSTITADISGTASNITGIVAIANGGTGQTTATAAFDALSPMTTGGDIIYGGASGTGTRLANGTVGQVLTSAGGTSAPSWTTPTTGDVTGPASSIDNHLVRFDGTTGKIIQDGSTAVLSDAGALSGLTQLTVDNIDINGNTITATGILDITSSGDLGIFTTAGGLNLEAFNGIIGVNNARITSVASPISGTDAANKDYVDASNVTLAPVGASPNANAATLTGQVLNLEPASASFPGVVTTGTQTFAGAKTFTSTITGSITGTASNVTGVVAVANGGTGVTSVTTAPTATAFAGWDANRNLSADSFIAGYATTVTAAGTTTLTVDSMQQQYFTGTTAETLALPVTSTLVLGQSYYVTNNSTGTVTVQSSGGNTILAMAAGTSAIYTVILASGTTAASWSATYVGNGGAVTPTVQKLTAGSAATYTTPAGVVYLRVRMIGAGGGGSGSGTSAQTSGSASATPNTLFSTSADVAILTAGSGGGGTQSGAGGTGGTATVGSGAIEILAKTGNRGDGVSYSGASTAQFAGGAGGDTVFGGGTGMVDTNIAGRAPVANSGAGGGGGGSGGVTVCYTGSGGGAGGYIEAFIFTPSATYHYTIAAGGAAGNAGTSGFAGAAGASGYIEVTEFYSNGAVGTATNVTGIVALANGGTNKNLTPINGGVVWTDADSMEVTAAGTTGQYLKSNGAAAPTWTSFTAPTMPSSAAILSGTGATYTTPAGVRWLRIRMVGGGGAGSNSGNATGTGGSAATATTWVGSTTSTAGAGSGNEGISTNRGSVAGTASLGAGHIGLAISGGMGGGVGPPTAGAGGTDNRVGGHGGSSAFGGAGSSAFAGTGGGSAGAANSGAGGGGAGTNNSSGAYPGVGGGSGGYCDFIIVSPAASYTYTVGTGGVAHTAGFTGAGLAGGNGGSGVIFVEENYQ